MNGRMWKWFFFILLFCNIVILSYICFQLLRPTGQFALKEESMHLEGTSKFTVSTDKKSVNKWIYEVMNDHFSAGKIPFHVFLDDQVNLGGEINVLSTSVPFHLIFHSEVTEEGNLLLKVKTILLGKIKMPVKLLLQEIADMHPFPKWMTIFPEEEVIYVSLTTIQHPKFSHLRLLKFDLYNDHIAFELYK